MKRKAYIRPKSYIVEDSEFMLLASTGGPATTSFVASSKETLYGNGGVDGNKSWLTKEHSSLQDEWDSDYDYFDW